MMKTLFTPTVTTAMFLATGAVLAQPHGPPGVTIVQGENTEQQDASASYAGASDFDHVFLSQGTWKITLSGAVTLDGDAIALNCGLRIEDEGSPSGYTMIAKQNSAIGGETGRVGFAVVGGLTVRGNDPVRVDAVCYGGGSDSPDQPFEHNLVAVGGSVAGN